MLKPTMKRFAAALFAGWIGMVMPAVAGDTSINRMQDISGRVVHLALNKSLIIDLPEDVKDIMVSNPAIADAVIRSNRKIYLIGVAPGEANIFLFGEGNRQMAQFELVVARDTIGLQSTISSVIPGSQVKAESLGDSIVLSGSAPNPEGAAKAADIAARFIGDPAKIVNMIQVAGSDQVNLRVVIAEVQRNTAKQLGVDLMASGGFGGITFNQIVDNPFSVAGKALSGTGLGLSSFNGLNGFGATLRALQQDGVIRTLAEPNLTAVSGQNADFLVGGEIPIITGYDPDAREYKYEFKKYGVGLSFTPVVMSAGRISLKIKTEISEIDPTMGLTFGSNAPTIVGFKVRKAETTVELPSGGSLALGGLVKDDVRQTINGVPGLMDVPILGALFKSRDFQRSQTELVVFVTPYVVDPVATSALQRPDQNLSFNSDAQTYFLHQINKVYANQGVTPPGRYHGRIGFAYE
jgi:pilus assembly protein CpaC